MTTGFTPIASTSTGFFIIGSTGMPSQTRYHGTEASVIVILRSLFQGGSNGIINSLIISWLANLLGSFLSSGNGEFTCRNNAISISGLLEEIISAGADESSYSNDRQRP